MRAAVQREGGEGGAAGNKEYKTMRAYYSEQDEAHEGEYHGD